MSLVISYAVAPEFVMVATDTLSTCATDDRDQPRQFVAKCAVLAELECVVSSLGCEAVGDLWIDTIRSMSLRDLDELEAIAQTSMRAVWSSLKVDGAEPSKTCLYLHGWSPRREAYRVLLFESWTGFEPEECAYGTVHMRPSCDAILEGKTLIEVAEIAQAAEAAKDDGVLIGGDLIGYELGSDENGVRAIRVRKLARFANYEDTRAAIERERAAAGLTEAGVH